MDRFSICISISISINISISISISTIFNFAEFFCWNSSASLRILQRPGRRSHRRSCETISPLFSSSSSFFIFMIVIFLIFIIVIFLIFIIVIFFISIIVIFLTRLGYFFSDSDSSKTGIGLFLNNRTMFTISSPVSRFVSRMIMTISMIIVFNDQYDQLSIWWWSTWE